MSSHREAPEISQDPAADNTDVYAFVSPDRPDFVTIIANFLPLQQPYGGPNFYEFSDDVRYRIHVANRGTAESDIIFQFNFFTRVRNPDTFLYNTGPIESLDSESWNRPQTYRLTRIEGGRQTVLGRGLPVPPERLERDWSQPYQADERVEQAWLTVYRAPREYWDLYQLGEKLVDLEDAFRQWRFRHVTTVERIIGFKRGTGGSSGVPYLRRMLEVVLFPELWKLRTDL